MSNPLLDLSSKDELISSLLSGSSTSKPKETPTGERKTFKVQSDLLARLEDFLPKIKEANAQLEQKVKEDPKAVDIENVDEESGEQYIEMDLGLGVFDMKKNVTEDDIIINPSSVKTESQTNKPTIVMMDVDKDTGDKESSDNESKFKGSSTQDSSQQILTKPASTATDDEDVVMSS
ncbi:hypothetical protein BG011_006160 [Mortierella polycephala]|uniref:Uncharacterized protein n=1 Tax=Mortierella polycephala TaxID=41804 RepID=A0A9P6QDJ7_9FUNG|nr:hypothetical protein BG011_006160 [Mortierella polycephala]